MEVEKTSAFGTQNKITVYHGSREIIKKPRFGQGKTNNDYGVGFYLTQNKHMAGEWAVLNSGVDGFINEYRLDMSGLRVLDLDSRPVEEWLSVLASNRGGSYYRRINNIRTRFINKFLISVDEYDIIKGHRADDSFFSYVRDFFAGIVSIEEIKQALYFGDLGTQICLKSFKAFQQIIYVNNFDATVKKYYYSATSRDDSARLKYAKLVEESFGTGTVISDILED